MQTGWRLERTFVAGAGRSESRLEGLDISWSQPFEPTAHAALWADNGTGKTMITALRYALYLPNARDFIRGDSDRSLAALVRSGDVCHVVEQASRVIGGELQRIVVGMVASWPDSGAQDLDNPSRLQRSFYGWLCDEDGPMIDDLPFRTSIGRWSTRIQFLNAIRELLPPGGAVPPHPPSEHQGNWARWLVVAGVDLDQVRFQTEMNASEGGVDRVMKFVDSDDFVRWLIGATAPTSTIEQITRSIDILRKNAASRPHWTEELNLWERIIDPLLQLAVAHEAVVTNQQAVATAEADAAAVLADTDATMTALAQDRSTAAELYDRHEQGRRESGATLRRAQAHRLRMQLRAAELRVQRAEGMASERRGDRDTAARELAAWELVADVLESQRLGTALAGLEEQRDAAEKETADLRRRETGRRHALARLLTERRDVAAGQLRIAREKRDRAVQAQQAAEADLQSALTDQGTVAEQIRQCTELVGTAEQLVADAVANGLLAEGADPVKQDATLAQTVELALSTRNTADAALGEADSHITEQQQARSAAHKRVLAAAGDATTAARELESINKRVAAICADERLLDIIGDINDDPWAERRARSDSLQRHAERADRDANAAGGVLTAAQRTIDSVRADGLLPPSHLVEEIAERCQHAELPAWPGWRWLADTMAPDLAATFATARPDIVSGVVIGHPDLVERAVDVIGDVDLEVALWIGAVMDPNAAQRGENHNATQARILLPPAGMYDRDTATRMVTAATEKKAEATERLRTAKQRADDTRAAIATLGQLWADLPNDPRPGLASKIAAAKQRQHDAELDEQAAKASLDHLEAERREWQRQRNEAQQRIDAANQTRLSLAPVIAAQTQAATAQAQLPGLRESTHDLRVRAGKLRTELDTLADDIEDAKEQMRVHNDRHQDVIEALRAAGLSPITEGTLPVEDEATIRAQLAAIESALNQAAIDPELHAAITRTRYALSDVTARLGSDTELRAQSEELAGTEGARHPVALVESVRLAKEREAHAREEFAKAAAAAETARSEYRQKIEDRADKSSPDVEGYPPAEHVADESEAERYAIRLDGLATQLGERQRTEERLAKEAENAIQRADAASKLVETSAKPLRHLANAALSGRRADNIDRLIEQITTISDRVRTTRLELSTSEHDQARHANAIRAHANGPQARKVEDRKDQDPRVVDLILRLRADDQLPAEAERIAGHLEQRAATLRDDLNNHDQHVRTCATMLQVQAATAIQRLRAYQNQSRLPDGLGDWTDRRFVVIEHEPEPADESVAVDRVARIVHALLTPGSVRSDAKTMLFAAARALVDAPFRVRLLKPHTDLALDRVDVAELKNFSGGQRVTAGVLLYATMTRVRAAGDATSIGWLWLDNPFGQASADQFVRTMRLAADKLGLQLVFTAAPKDKGALSMFDRIITLSRRSRPSSGEKVVIVDDKAHEITDLTLIQKDVLAVLGE